MSASNVILFPVRRRPVDYPEMQAIAASLGHVSDRDRRALANLAERITGSRGGEKLLAHLADVVGMGLTRRHLRRWLHRIAPLYLGEQWNP